MVYEFEERRIFSGTCEGRGFEEIIKSTLPGIVAVEKTNTEIDKTGIDYFAKLRRGAVTSMPSGSVRYSQRSVSGCSPAAAAGIAPNSTATMRARPAARSVSRCLAK